MSRIIFFDLDATLYSYSKGHQAGLERTYTYWKTITSDPFEIFYDKYMNGRKAAKRFLGGSVASHSRALYFQNMVETEFETSIPFHIAELTQLYWDSFINNITPFEGVKETLEKLKDLGFKLAIITNMSAEVQMRKLHKLGIDPYFDVLITSEEAGQQKPHPHIYLHAMNRFTDHIVPENCFMVGDSFEHDVEAPEFLGMTGILVTMDLKKIPEKATRVANTFSEIYDIIETEIAEPLDGVIKFALHHRNTGLQIDTNVFQELIDLRDRLKELNLIGVYPDDYYMTPGVGFGNASIRYTSDHQFLVSGSQTGPLITTTQDHYSLVTDCDIDNNALTSKGPIKPSSESMSHAAIFEIAPEVKCVIHVHSKKMWDAFEKFDMPITPEDVLYGTPEMARALQDVYNKTPVLVKPICMRGHIEGLLTWGRTVQEALQLYLDIVDKLD